MEASPAWPGAARTYGSYWIRMAAAWGTRPLDQISASDIEALQHRMAATARSRRNSRHGRHAGEHVIAADNLHLRGAMTVSDDGRLLLLSTDNGLRIIDVSNPAQPAILRTVSERSRDDVQVWIAVDTSNSMLAARAPGAADRLRQAREAAAVLRRRLDGLQVGLAVMTSRLSRIIDRARVLEARLEEASPEAGERLREDLATLSQRAKLIGPAITLCTRLIGASDSAATWNTQAAVATMMPSVHQRLANSAPVERTGWRHCTAGAPTAPRCLNRKPSRATTEQHSASSRPRATEGDTGAEVRRATHVLA